MVGRTNNFCPWCKVPYFNPNTDRGIVHTLLPESDQDLAADYYPKTSLVECQTKSAGFLEELKTKKASTSLRAKYDHCTSEPFFKSIDFQNICVPEFHTVLNKAKRLDNRFLEIAKELDALLKCQLIELKAAELEGYTEWNDLIEKLKREPTNTKYKTALKKLRGPSELKYSGLLQQHRIRITTVHGRGFNGDSAYKMFATSGIADFMKTCKYGTITVGSDYVRDLFASYIKNVNRELTLTKKMILCDHEIEELKILNAENAREAAVLFPNHVPLMSDHYRTHLYAQMKRNRDLTCSERGTERKNQQMMKIKNLTKSIKNQKVKLAREVKLMFMKTM